MQYLQQLEILTASLNLLQRRIARPVLRWIHWSIYLYGTNLPLIPMIYRQKLVILLILGFAVLDPFEDGYNYKKLLKAGDRLVPGLIWIVIVFFIHPAVCHIWPIRWMLGICSSLTGLIGYGIFLILMRGTIKSWHHWWFGFKVFLETMGVALQLGLRETFLGVQIWTASRMKKSCRSDKTSGRRNSSPTQSFVYTPLPLKGKPIRLLLLHPRQPSAAIRCSLIHTSVSTLWLYEAVSYTWGAPERTHAILVDGHRLLVPANAHALLSDLSSSLLPRLIWIDSVCINQADVAEKSAQVAFMADIYQRAALVTVWLAHQPTASQKPSRARFDAGMDALCAFALVRQLCWLHGRSDDAALLESFEAVKRTRQWPPFVALLRNPWFSRVWIVQEAVLAHEARVRYGGLELPWKELAHGLSVVTEKSAIASVVEETPDWRVRDGASVRQLANLSYIEAWRRKRADGEEVDFREAMFCSRHFQASEKKDHVFALRGFCREERANKDKILWTEPNYGLGVHEVFLNAALRLIDEAGILALLPAAGIGFFPAGDLTEGLEKSPSWVPDWSRAPLLRSFSEPDRKAPYAAGGPSPGTTRHELRKKSLSLRAHILGTVEKLAKPWRLSFSPTDICQFVEIRKNLIHSYKIITDSYRDEDIYPFTKPPRKLQNAYWRLLIGDRTDNSRPAPAALATAYTQYKDTLKVMKDIVDSGQNKSMDAVLLNKYRDVPAYGHLALKAWAGRKVGVTGKGYMGLFPPFAEEGDVVCLIEGAATPFLLRKVAESPAFKLVGESFVLGIMDGEAIPTDGMWDILDIV